MTKKAVLLALAVLAFAGTLAQAALPLPCAPECGKDKDNMECADNLCCSKEGLCGLGSKYCSADAGCQSGACVENQRCGSQGGGATCPGNQCCSYLGYCGLGADYCGKDCQSGPCNVDNKCGRQPDGSTRECSNNLCCDKLGRCGLGGNYCSANAGCQSGACYDNKIIANQRCGAKYGNKVCLNKRCCSQWGYCGHQKEYCGSGCQPKFGTCSSPGAGGLDLGAILKCSRP